MYGFLYKDLVVTWAWGYMVHKEYNSRTVESIGSLPSFRLSCPTNWTLTIYNSIERTINVIQDNILP